MSTKLKTLLMTMILAGFSAQHAIAENLNNEDMAFAFEELTISTQDSAKIDLLSNQEMQAVEGRAMMPWVSMNVGSFTPPVPYIHNYIHIPFQPPIPNYSW
ncbi:MAG: hypothetical protein P8I13_05740 [Porticoccaceae bacterium]|nr:hypothetical protein [Porticoccaceae bacterium]